MAILSNPNQPQQNQQQGQQQAGAQNPTTFGLAGAQPGNSPASSAPNQFKPSQTYQQFSQNAAGQRQQQQRGTGFTNISQMLGANVGAGQQLGQNIAGNLQQRAKNLQTGLEGAYGQFQQQGQQQLQGAQNLMGKPGETPGLLQQYVETGSTNQNAPMDLANQVSNLKYTGPTQLQNQQQYQSGAARLGALGQMTGTAQGQQNLLGQMVAPGRNYTRGAATLDQALMGAQGGTQSLNQAARQMGQTVQNVQGTLGNVGNQAQAFQQGIQDTVQQGLKQLTAGEQGLIGTAQANATKISNNVDRFNKILSGQVSKNEITDADRDLIAHAADYGLDPNAMLYTGSAAATQQGLDPMAALKQYAATAGGVGKYQLGQSDAEKLQRYVNVLGNISGINSGFAGDQSAVQGALKGIKDFSQKVYGQNSVVDKMKDTQAKDVAKQNQIKAAYDAARQMLESKDFQQALQQEANTYTGPAIGGGAPYGGASYYEPENQWTKLSAPLQQQYRNVIQNFRNAGLNVGEGTANNQDVVTAQKLQSWLSGLPTSEAGYLQPYQGKSTTVQDYLQQLVDKGIEPVGPKGPQQRG